MRALIFGAKGSIGKYISEKFTQDNINVIGTTTNLYNISDNIILVQKDNTIHLTTIEPVDIVIWANGDNCNDNINVYDETTFTRIINANVIFILNTLQCLIKHKKINENAKMVIVSSIFEDITRDNKLSYSISKSALSGLVKNVAYDLSKQNILINNVLPGVLDNEMTHRTLVDQQIEYIKQNNMQFGRLINMSDVYNIVRFLVIENTGITGQSIKVDLGFTNVKKYI